MPPPLTGIYMYMVIYTYVAAVDMYVTCPIECQSPNARGGDIGM